MDHIVFQTEDESEVEFQDEYSDDESDESFDELDERTFDHLSPEDLGNVLRDDLDKEQFETEMDAYEFNTRMSKALDVICPD